MKRRDEVSKTLAFVDYFLGPFSPGFTATHSVEALTSCHSNQCRVRLQILHMESITGTSTKNPTTVAKAAPDCAPKREMATEFADRLGRGN